jgi:hypothetical protein
MESLQFRPQQPMRELTRTVLWKDIMTAAAPGRRGFVAREAFRLKPLINRR